jgi:phosphoribosyl 1,2-cyclic phosphodiesterase
VTASQPALRFASLGSGSRGNGTVVGVGDVHVLIDCGFPLRETERRLAELGLTPGDLTAILVTHEHSDHSAGVAALARRHGVPVFATWGTFGSGRIDGLPQRQIIETDARLAFGALEVCSVVVPHDAREPCQFVLAAGGCRLGVLTDLGSITPHVVEQYRGCDALMLECNHDLAMLQGGSYPPSLKRRIAGDFGHLSNRQAAAFLDCEGVLPRQLVIAHISEQNNSRQCVEDTLGATLDAVPEVVWAQQDDGFDWRLVGA